MSEGGLVSMDELRTWMKLTNRIAAQVKPPKENKPKKREREEKKEEEEVVVPPPPPVTTAENEDFTCVGQVWLDPVESCPGGAGSDAKARSNINGKTLDTCKVCKRLWTRYKKNNGLVKKKQTKTE